MLSQDEAKVILNILNQLTYKLKDMPSMLTITKKLNEMIDKPVVTPIPPEPTIKPKEATDQIISYEEYLDIIHKHGPEYGRRYEPVKRENKKLVYRLIKEL